MARRAAGAAASVATALLLLAPACGGDDGPAAESGPATTTEAPPDPIRVRVEERAIAGLPSMVVRPTDDGPYPLVVFVHGAGAAPISYEGLLRDLALAGNVVVAPAMPGSVDRADFSALLSLPFQPGRISAVIDAVTVGDQAIEVVSPDDVVVMGHSLGGMAALATAFNTCCQDSRVDAVVSIAGRLATFTGGTFGDGVVPALLVHGDEDETVPYSGSQVAAQTVGTSAYLLTVLGGDHGSFLAPGDEAYATVLDGVLAFLRATVGGDPRGGVVDLQNAGGREGFSLAARD